MAFNKKKFMGISEDKNGGSVPYFQDIDAWKAAAKKNSSIRRRNEAQQNNPSGGLSKIQNIQVTPGKWETK